MWVDHSRQREQRLIFWGVFLMSLVVAGGLIVCGVGHGDKLSAEVHQFVLVMLMVEVFWGVGQDLRLCSVLRQAALCRDTIVVVVVGYMAAALCVTVVVE